MWLHRGQQRPAFAVPPGPGQESVWDYPRPPAREPVAERVRVLAGEVLVADTRRAVRVLETASPPSFYLPPEDVDAGRLRAIDGASVCEWKGRASYFDVLGDGGRVFERAAWSYASPTPAFASLAGWFAFYPHELACLVGEERARPQGGRFYGGWVTDAIVGPWKGEPGRGGW